MNKIKVPANIGSHEVFIGNHVVDFDISMLLSRKSSKKGNTKINLRDDTLFMFGWKLDVVVTSSEHNVVPLNSNESLLQSRF